MRRACPISPSCTQAAAAWRASVPIYASGEQAGYATSGGWSPLLKKYIALAHLQSRWAAPGTAVEMEITVEHRRKRAAALPAIPTFIEQGYPNFEAVLWQGIAGPAGTPRAIIARFNREMTAVLTLPEVRQSLLEQGFEAEPGPPEAMLARLKDDIEKWRAVVAKANLTKP